MARSLCDEARLQRRLTLRDDSPKDLSLLGYRSLSPGFIYRRTRAQACNYLYLLGNGLWNTIQGGFPGTLR